MWTQVTIAFQVFLKKKVLFKILLLLLGQDKPVSPSQYPTRLLNHSLTAPIPTHCISHLPLSPPFRSPVCPFAPIEITQALSQISPYLFPSPANSHPCNQSSWRGEHRIPPQCLTDKEKSQTSTPEPYRLTTSSKPLEGLAKAPDH